MKWVQVKVSRIVPVDSVVGGGRRANRMHFVAWFPVSRIATVIEANGDYGGLVVEGDGPYDVAAEDVTKLLAAITEVENGR